jgi:Uma2 family endonuclease
MTTVRDRSLTLQQFLALPEVEPALEYFNGKVTQKVSPLGEHGRLQSKFSEMFNGYAEPRRLGMAFTEIRATFAGASRVPDIAVYRWDRIPRSATGRIARYFRTPPDIAVEILSPGQSLPKLADKCRWFVANGVTIALLVNDRTDTITRFGSDGTEHRLAKDDRIDLDQVLPGFALTVQALFDTLQIDPPRSHRG